MLKAVRAIQRPRIDQHIFGAHALPPEFKNFEKYIDYLIERVLPEVTKEKLADRADIFIEKGYFNPKLAKNIL
ncbi:MAG: hypothetical protein R2827_07225 [Bdellovibrionales bacterium]